MSKEAENRQENRRKVSRRRFLKTAALTAGATAMAGVATPLLLNPEVAQSVTLTISKADYYDKTLAGILGQVAGFLSGYEFVSPNPMPDNWWIDITYGPYSGDTNFWRNATYNGYDRHHGPHFQTGQVGSDDDYHMDFFNQLILDQHGVGTTFQDIRQKWLDYSVSDWGATAESMRLMREDGLIAPLTGQAEFNKFYWLTEAYIETETIGMVAPGMPNTARDLDEKFALVVAEFDSVIWAKWCAAMYAIAYFETDARVAMEKAAAVLPRNSWTWLIYDKAKKLHAQNSTDWRWAQAELMKFRRNVYQQDNEQAIPDINNGCVALSILYGNNDYTLTAKISSLIGNDADCTAATAVGLLGIVKGMAGTPQVVKDRLYQNGNGVMVNDRTTGFPPFIDSPNYPLIQKWTDIAAMYQRNAERFITANGGTVGATSYTINGQTLQTEAVVPINNYDFEQGSLNGWTKWTPVTDTANPHAFAENNGTAQSGNWKGTVFTDSTVNEVKLYVQLSGLESGATYRANAFVQTNGSARFYAENYGGAYRYASIVETAGITMREWVNRSLEFTVSGTTAQIGLHLPPGASAWAAIDNLFVQKITNPAKTRYEAENATRSGGSVQSSSSASNGSYIGGLDNIGEYVQFNVNLSAAGEYRLNIGYANGWTGVSRLYLYVNGGFKHIVPFPRTGSWGTFADNIMRVPVVLAAGNNTIKLQRDFAAGYVELDYIELSGYPQAVYQNLPVNLVSNGGFEASGATQNPTGWSTWSPNGSHNDADFTEGGGWGGTYRCTHYKASAYEVYTSQTITGLTNGSYVLRAWVVGGGGQEAAFMSAKNYGASVPELKANIPGNGWPNWSQVIISGIPVTNGQCTIGFYSKALGGQWLSFDEIEFYRM
jgi:hypothetical protein